MKGNEKCLIQNIFAQITQIPVEAELNKMTISFKW